MNKYDSSKLYPKFKQAVDALDYADSKGWELIHVYNQTTTAETTFYLLRRKLNAHKPTKSPLD
jgi:hypothetical protein